MSDINDKSGVGEVSDGSEVRDMGDRNDMADINDMGGINDMADINNINDKSDVGDIGASSCENKVDAEPVAPTAPIPPAAPLAPTAPIPPAAPLAPTAPIPPAASVVPTAPIPPAAPLAPTAPIPPAEPVAPTAFNSSDAAQATEVIQSSAESAEPATSAAFAAPQVFASTSSESPSSEGKNEGESQRTTYTSFAPGSVNAYNLEQASRTNNSHGQNTYGLSSCNFGQNPGGANPGGTAAGANPGGTAAGANPGGTYPGFANPYGQNPYGQDPYGQNPYGQDPYGQNPYGQNPGPFGQAPHTTSTFNAVQTPASVVYFRPGSDYYKTPKWPWVAGIISLVLVVLVLCATSLVGLAALVDSLENIGGGYTLPDDNYIFGYGDIDNSFSYDGYTRSDIESLFPDLGGGTSGGKSSAGIYEVGSSAEIDAGMYFFEGSLSAESYFYVFKPLETEADSKTYELDLSIVYFGNYYADLEQGDLVVFDPGQDSLDMYPVALSALSVGDTLTSGCYRVGVDIEPGTYSVSADETAAAATNEDCAAYVMKDLQFLDDSITDTVYVMVGQTRTVVVEEGQYLELFAANATFVSADTSGSGNSDGAQGGGEVPNDDDTTW